MGTRSRIGLGIVYSSTSESPSGSESEVPKESVALLQLDSVASDLGHHGWKAFRGVDCPSLLDVVVGAATGEAPGGRVRRRRPLRDGSLLGRIEAESPGRCREGSERFRCADSEGQKTAGLPPRPVRKQGAEGAGHDGRLRQNEHERALQK